ncbi:hypothetical protein [Oceanobacter mangrovi]|uniref:hypothetical protein n=1 Tax=Oceanobacter mangrovi TaxID=2862510 RepID=UPI001C8D6A89|nr:hypothetical protein [Oceanobacter mangrovi]
MKLAPHELRDCVIRPTMKYLGCDSIAVENFLIALSQMQQVDTTADNSHCSIYPINRNMHRVLWDEHLAFDPDRASLVRGLASQRQFLNDPDIELQTNLAYATAIAWAMYVVYPGASELHAIARPG